MEETTITPLAIEPVDIIKESSLSPRRKTQRRQSSLSEKWASSKSLALEFLKRQREVMLWIGIVLSHEFSTMDIYDELKSGIILRDLLSQLYPAACEGMTPISRHYQSFMAPWKERENISVFLKQCKALGMNDMSLFCTDDLYEGTNLVQVLFGLQHFMKFTMENGNAQHVQSSQLVPNDATTVFSNQEVEMAISKLEKAGEEANVLMKSMFEQESDIANSIVHHFTSVYESTELEKETDRPEIGEENNADVDFEAHETLSMNVEIVDTEHQMKSELIEFLAVENQDTDKNNIVQNHENFELQITTKTNALDLNATDGMEKCSTIKSIEEQVLEDIITEIENVGTSYVVDVESIACLTSTRDGLVVEDGSLNDPQERPLPTLETAQIETSVDVIQAGSPMSPITQQDYLTIDNAVSHVEQSQSTEVKTNTNPLISNNVSDTAVLNQPQRNVRSASDELIEAKDMARCVCGGPKCVIS